MNRNDLQRLAGRRIREARTLFRAGEYSGAYYLAGYVVECALKACYARTTQRYDFPAKTARQVFTHNLTELVVLAGLNKELEIAIRKSGRLAANWNITCEWSEDSRYKVWIRDDAEAILSAINTRRDGVLPWIKQYW
jgi:HEPN domain-containing protein